VVGLIGPSGSGKSTLLKCLGAVIEPTAGRMTLGDEVIYADGWKVRDLRALRRDKIGFVFQAPYLIPFLDVTDNVALLPMLAGVANAPARARALALNATIVAAGVVVGLVLGGALVSADLLGTSWRPVFLVNVPVGAVLLAVGRRALPDTRSPAVRRLDLPGAALLSATVALVVIPLVFGHEAGWAWWTFACLAAAAPAGVVLVRHLRRTDDPVLDLALLARPAFARGTVALSAQMVAYGGFLFSLTLYLQERLGYSALECGLVFAPYALGFALMSLAAPGLPAALLRRVIPLGLVACAAAYAGVGIGGWSLAVELPLLAVAGAGFGAGFTPTMIRMIGGLPPALAPDASGMITTNVQLCYALGVATIGSAYVSSGATTFGGVAEACAVLALVSALLAGWMVGRSRGAAAAQLSS